MVLIPILVCLFLNFVTVKIFHIKFGEAISFTLLFCGFIMYFGQYVFSSYNVGVILICLAAAIGVTFLIHDRKNLSSYFTSGFLMFLLICLVVVIYDYKRQYTDFDEFWHWGTMVKESLRLDKFYAVPESRLIIHKDYPPFLCMIEILFVKLSGNYSEGITTMGLHIFALSILMCPVSEKISNAFTSKKKSIHFVVSTCLPLLCTVLLINIIDAKHIGGTLLADIPMALVFAYALLLILLGEIWKSKFHAACFTLSVCSVVMIKQVGIALALLLLLYAVLIGIADRIRPKKIILVVCSAVLFTVLCYFSWAVFVKNCNINDLRQSNTGGGQFDLAKISIQEFINVILGNEQGLRFETFRQFMWALVSRNVASPSIYCLSFTVCLLISVIMVAVMFASKLIDKRRMIALEIGNVIGFLGYAFMLLVLFIFCFSDDEMKELRGYERYSDGLVLGIFIAYILFAVLLYLKSGRRTKYAWIGVIAGIFFLFQLNMPNLYYLYPQRFRINPYLDVRMMGEEIEAEAEDDSTVIMVYDPSLYWLDGYLQSIAYHYANNCNLPWNLNIYSNNFENDNIQQTALDNMAQADYLYIVHTNTSMNNFFLNRNNGENLEPRTLYKIIDGSIERCDQCAENTNKIS